LVCANTPTVAAQGGAAATTIQSQKLSHTQIQAHVLQLVSVDCSASPVKVFAGGVVTIQAQGRSVQNLALRYTFTTDAGQLSQNGATARLNTAGLGARTVHVICAATDTAGRAATQTVVVTVMGVPHTEELHLPPKPIPAPVILPPAPTPQHNEDAHKTGNSGAVPTIAQPDQGVAPAPPPPAPAPAPAPVTPEPQPDKPATDGAHPVAPDVYTQGEAIEKWKSYLKTGRMDYNIPNVMQLQQPVTASVVIHGINATGAPLAPGAAQVPLKVSDYMRVDLIATGDPSAFTITPLPEGEKQEKLILPGGTTQWLWSVTPNKPGTRQPLHVRAMLIYINPDKTETQTEIQSADVSVQVDVPSLWSRIWSSFVIDPAKPLSYIVPGGAGFTFIAGIVVWWWKRKHKEEKE
jgi:hypothetical protein